MFIIFNIKKATLTARIRHLKKHSKKTPEEAADEIIKAVCHLYDYQISAQKQKSLNIALSLLLYEKTESETVKWIETMLCLKKYTVIY